MGTTAVRSGDAMSPALARELAETEYQRLVGLLESLEPQDWTRQTDCPQWQVHHVARHLLGNMQAAASPVEALRQLRAGKRWADQRGGSVIDGQTAIQVEANSALSHDDLVAEIRRTWPRALRTRFRLPRVLCEKVTIPTDTPSGEERWTLGLLTQVVLTRDTWMHRMDIDRATGRDFVTDGSHDGTLVSDMVAEWSRRHGLPFSLELTGPAGGSFVQGADGPRITLDAVEFGRVVAGRVAGGGLLAHQVAF